MSDRRNVWQTLSRLLTRLETDLSTRAPADTGELRQEVRKLGRMQFKANALAERQVDQWEQAVAAMQEAQAAGPAGPAPGNPVC